MGSELKIWEIESGICAYEFTIEELIGESMSTLTILTYTRHFEYVALHAADDDFNQQVVVIDTRKRRHQQLNDFGLKDEFYDKSAAFSDGGEDIVFVHGQSVEGSGAEEGGENIVLNVYSVINQKYRMQLQCGL